VNRDVNASHKVTVNLNGLSVTNGNYKTLQLSSLPASETFKSHTNNALKENSVTVASNSLTITLPALSTTAVLLQSIPTTGVNEWRNKYTEMKLFPNPVENQFYISIGATVAEPTQITVFDQQGRRIKVIDTNFDGHSAIKVDLSSIQQGYYFLSVKSDHYNSVKSFVVKR
jgi:hypothetical protein